MQTPMQFYQGRSQVGHAQIDITSRTKRYFCSWISLLLLLDTISITSTYSSQVCPEGCRCDAEVAECSNGMTTRLPNNLQMNFTTIILSSNYLTHLPAGKLAILPLLQNINLDENKLQFLNTSDFSVLNELLTISAAHNAITEVNISKPLRKARYCNLRNNQITRVLEATEEKLPRITKLDLGKNKLKICHGLEPLRNLKTLYLDDNAFDTFNASCFRRMTRLKHLSLARNSIRHIDSRSPVYLTHLDVRGNRLSKLDARDFANMPQLTVLQLGKNAIDDKNLNLSENCLPSLEILNVDENHLQTFDSRSYKRIDTLAYLGLWRNNISTVHIGEGPQALRVLSLAANQIKSLVVDSRAVRCMRHLRILKLQRNPLHCDCSLLDAVNALSKVHIQGTCASPEHLNGVNVKSLSHKLVNCTHTRRQNQYCPHNRHGSAAYRNEAKTLAFMGVILVIYIGVSNLHDIA